MSTFFYRAKDKNNRIIEDYIEASSFANVVSRLEKKGYTILEIKEDSVASYNSDTSWGEPTYDKEMELTIKEKKEFYNSFFFLYSSGHSVFEIFKLIKSSNRNSKIRAICNKLLKKVEKGASLKESIAPIANSIGFAYANLIIAGEESGKLDEILKDITKNINREEDLKNTTIQEMIYPTILIFAAITVFLLFKFFVLKVFEMMAEGNLPTNPMGMFIETIIKIVIIYLIFAGIIIFLCKNKTTSKAIKDFITNLEIFQTFVKLYSFINFFSVMALAYEAGVPTSEAVILANSLVKLKELNVRIKKTQKMIGSGCTVTTAFAASGVFSNYALSQISAGENSGELGKMFANIANDYEKKLDLTFNVLKKIMGPILLVLVAILVAYVIYKGHSGYINGIFGMI